MIVTVAEMLKTWRKGAGLTQSEAAERAGVSQATWSDWENDQQLPRLDKALDLVDLTGEKALITATAEQLRQRGAA